LHLHEAAGLLGMTPQWMNVIELGAVAKLKRSEKLRVLSDDGHEQSLPERILVAFADLSRRGQRLVSAADICRELGIESRERQIGPDEDREVGKRLMRVYREIGRLVEAGKLEHDGGRQGGKGAGARLYWLAESTP
jgi:hypothetical protein